MSSMLAIVTRGEFEMQSEGKQPGETLSWRRYESKQSELRKLGTRGRLFLVTVRPGESLWRSRCPGGGGLTLRSDLHRLFDLGYATVDDEHRLVVSRRLADDFGNGRSYRGFHGRRLVLPASPSEMPDAGVLGWHRENRFLG